MPRDDRGEIEMKLLQSLESLRILREVREIEIAELLFENAVPVKNFLLREKHEDDSPDCATPGCNSGVTVCAGVLSFPTLIADDNEG